MALTRDRNTPRRDGADYSFDVAAGAVIHLGAMVVLDSSGNAKSGAAAAGLIAVGRAETRVDNSGGAAGDAQVAVHSGVFRWANSSAADEITKAEIGDMCWIVDDETVAKTDGGSARSRAGTIVDVDENGVWVEMGVEILSAPATALLAGNNLSDVTSKATSRSNLGVAEKMGTPTITVGAADSGTVAIQLKDSAGADLAVRGSIQAYISDDANGDSIAAAAPSGGVAIGTDGLLIPQVAGKAFTLVSEADGNIDLAITEAGAATWYLILVMPDGKLVASTAITFTA